jgi:FixJ family two-component response regulator
MELSENHKPLICVIDDDDEVRSSLDSLLRSAGYRVRDYEGPQDYLADESSDEANCLILDVRLRGADGLDFQQDLVNSANLVPVVIISGHGDIPMTVRGMKAGAVNFLPKPFDDEDMLSTVAEAVNRDRLRREQAAQDDSLRGRYDGLTPREREIMGLVTAGLMNKQVAARLNLSEITVKIHRGNLMKKMAVASLADLVRIAEGLGVRDPNASRYGHHCPSN